MAANIASPTVTTVLIVDDHPAVREGLATRIARQPDLEVCAEAANLPEALRAFEECQPTIVVIDIALDKDNGIDLVRRIRARDGTTRILVWSMYPESLYAERALRAGANGYITKAHATSSIVDAIRAVRDGKLYLSEDAANQLLRRSVNAQAIGASPIELLSDRELQVFGMIGEGVATREIARQLHVSVNTIETHRQRIRAKLGLQNAAELNRAAVEWKLERY
jgi:DNA-binding NarL/FixJ family response regulator